MFTFCRYVAAFACITAWTLATQAQAGEKLSGTNVDVRTLLFFESPDATVAKMLPNGWEIGAPPKGPFKNFNLVVVLVDSLSALDANAKPVPTFHGAVFAIPAKKKGAEDRGVMVVDGIAAADSMPGSYGVYTAGQVQIERTYDLGSEGKSTAKEKWKMVDEDGNSIETHLEYKQGATNQSEIKTKAHSGAKPEFFRLYRGSQITRLLRSSVIGVDHVTNISVSASGSRLGPLFDGTEKLIAVLSVPSYVRSVYLPE